MDNVIHLELDSIAVEPATQTLEVEVDGLDLVVDPPPRSIETAAPDQLVGEVVQIPGPGVEGSPGWSPVLRFVPHEGDLIVQVHDWIGGQGAKPPVDLYIGESGYVSDPDDAHVLQSNPLNQPPGEHMELRVLTPLEIGNRELTLEQFPSHASRLRLTVIGGIEQHNGVDFVVTGKVVSWDSLALELLVIVGSVVMIEYPI